MTSKMSMEDTGYKFYYHATLISNANKWIDGMANCSLKLLSSILNRSIKVLSYKTERKQNKPLFMFHTYVLIASNKFPIQKILTYTYM